MEFPIKLKYLTITEGNTQPHIKEEVPLPGYELKDGQGYIVASGTSLANLFEYALQVDASYELMYQFVVRGNLEECKHLEGLDCDDTGPVQFALPGMGQGGGGSGGPILQ